jgi:hypothetical protein
MPPNLRVALPALVASTFLAAQGQPNSGTAEAGLTEFANVCKESGNRLWGVSLCGRLVLVEPRSRMALATMQDPDRKFESKDGLFAGRLPP